MTRLTIPDMSCSHCKATVSAALAAVPGVTSVDIDVAAKTARVEGSAADALLIAALDRAGYPATPSG